MAAQSVIAVVDQSQIGEARRAAARLAETFAMSETKRGAVAIIATELATNLVRHAQNGRLLLQVLNFTAGTCVELLAIDSGPGMNDLQRCMQDGYSSGGTAGTGFGAIRRMSDDFDAFSTPERGTVVVSRVRGDGWTDEARPTFRLGAISMPAPNETVCGDIWRLAERDGEIAVMLADGLGHGPQAAHAAELAAKTFDEYPFVEDSDYFARAHRTLTGSRGAAVACAHVNREGKVRYSGIGNIAGMLIGTGRSRGLPSQNGTVGVQIRKTHASADYEWPDRGLLVMHSDGLTTRWTIDGYAGLLVRHPAIVAGVLFRDFLRGRDDVTVVVLGLGERA